MSTAPSLDSTMSEVEPPTTYWNVRIDATLAARVELALWDPKLRKPKYGARKLLLEHLLWEWLNNQAEEPNLSNIIEEKQNA